MTDIKESIAKIQDAKPQRTTVNMSPKSLAKLIHGSINHTVGPSMVGKVLAERGLDSEAGLNLKTLAKEYQEQAHLQFISGVDSMKSILATLNDEGVQV